MNLQQVKQRFEIIGNSPLLNIALETAMKVAPTDITVLITGESGVGKEVFSKVIHHLSNRKHGPFIAVNCGAIPEGTIDSELFGHEKGAFTGASDSRKGYFETVSGGTIFLDEVGELPLETQSRLLRVLETGEFIKVGSSKVQKTDVRVVAATNRDLLERTQKEKFREDLYYRLSTVPIKIPALRERKDDIYLLFRKFAAVYAEKYKTDAVVLDESAQKILVGFRWPGNIRQLKNMTEQISVLEQSKLITADVLMKYLPTETTNLPMVIDKNGEGSGGSGSGFSERDIFYKVLFDLRKDVSDLKKVVVNLIENSSDSHDFIENNEALLKHVMDAEQVDDQDEGVLIHTPEKEDYIIEASDADREHENLSLEQKEVEMIKKALAKNNGKRKKAAQDLGISERTLYRKIKQYELDA